MAGLGSGDGGSGAIRAGRAFVELLLKDRGVYASLAKLEQKFKAFASVALKAGAIGAGTAVAMAPVVSTFASFDDAMLAVGARTQATAAQLASMTEKAKELGRTTSFSAASVAALMNELGTAGFNPEQINEATAAVLDLARATGTDAALSAQILGATLNQFGLKAADSARVADMLTAAANASAVSMEDLGESLKYAGPVAQGLGLSLRDTIAVIGGLGNAGIRGSEAGTALRRISLLVATGGKEIKEMFGVETEGKEFLQILDEISQSVAGLDVASRATKMKDFFDILGITGATVIGKSAASIRDLQRAIGDSDGIAAKTAAQMDSGLGGSIRRVKGAVESMAIALGESLAPVLKFAGQEMTAAAAAVRAFLAENRTAAIAVSAVVVGLVAAAGGMLALAVASKVAGLGLGLVVGALALVKAGILLLVSPFVLVSAAAVGLVAMLAEQLPNAAKDVASALGSAFEWVGGIFDGVTKDMQHGFRDFANTAEEAWGGISAAIAKGDLAAAAAVAFAGISVEWAKAVVWWTDIWNKFKSTVVDGWRKVVAGFASAFAWVGEKTGLVEAGTVDAVWAEYADTRAAAIASRTADLKSATDALEAAEAKFRRVIEDAKRAIPGPAIAAAAAAIATGANPVAGDPLAAMLAGLGKVKGAFDISGAISAAASGISGGASAGDPSGMIGGAAGAILAGAAAAAQVYDRIKGSFGVSSAAQQFGYGDQAGKRQEDILKRIANGQDVLPKKIGEAVLSGIVLT